MSDYVNDSIDRDLNQYIENPPRPIEPFNPEQP